MSNEEKIGRIRQNHFFARGDIVVYAALLLLIFVFTLFAFETKEKRGTHFEILYNGQTVFSESLQKDALYIFYVDENGRGRVVAGQTTQGLSDFNVIEVKDGKVSVILSDCADKVCYGSGVCLPHKMTLKIFYDEWESDI